MKAKNYTTPCMYQDIEEDVLLDSIGKAKLILKKDAVGVSINQMNVLFGTTDYKIHSNTIEEAESILKERVNNLSSFDLMQRLNYFKDGNLFDTIIFHGYRGGYNFYIGWNNGITETSYDGAEMNYLMATMF